MKVKRILSGLLAVAMVFSLTACSGIMEPKKNDGKKTVGIAMPTKTLERWNRDGAYLKKKFEDAGYNVELTYSDNKIDQQVKDIESLIADDVNLLDVVCNSCSICANIFPSGPIKTQSVRNKPVCELFEK